MLSDQEIEEMARRNCSDMYGFPENRNNFINGVRAARTHYEQEIKILRDSLENIIEVIPHLEDPYCNMTDIQQFTNEFYEAREALAQPKTSEPSTELKENKGE